MKRIIIFICAALFGVSLSAQESVGSLMAKYSKTPQADYFEASGLKMMLVRPALLASPLAPVAYDVQSIAVLQMGRTSEQVRDEFHQQLVETLSSYDDFGTHDSPDGPVLVYAVFSGKNTVSELIIFNPVKYTLNDIRGSFSVSSLQKLQ